jgi:lipopolysaccharide/colanic/teichoic acid biosynthesis glycosyltransferase
MKRTFDVIFAVLGLLVLSPVIVVLAVFVRLVIGSPIFFRQQRPGLGVRPFWLVKLRSMANVSDAPESSNSDAARLGRFGRWLRSTSLDELPELWNVLRGDMSLVGPRPLLMEYLPLYSERQARRHEVRPGLTGWAQVNGRNAANWERRLELDVWYVENQSFSLDLVILWRTVQTVFARTGISQDGEATMAKFRGNHDN